MDINEIRESIANDLSSAKTHELWGEILQETDPANYGFEVDDVYVDMGNIWVDIPKRSFSFKNLQLNFSARLGASNPRDGYDEDFKFIFAGAGTFDFQRGGRAVSVEKIKIDEKEDLELYGESSSRID